MEIETKSASIDTFSVTIQALHVNGKQMTLAVFRQLPLGQEQGGDELWGSVRYEIKNQGHLWLVFSHDGRLFRRAIEKVYPPEKNLCNVRTLEKKLIELNNHYLWEDRQSQAPDCGSPFLMRLAYANSKTSEHDRMISRTAIESQIEEAKNEAQQWFDDAAASYLYSCRLLALPQLFIAV